MKPFPDCKKKTLPDKTQIKSTDFLRCIILFPFFLYRKSLPEPKSYRCCGSLRPHVLLVAKDTIDIWPQAMKTISPHYADRWGLCGLLTFVDSLSSFLNTFLHRSDKDLLGISHCRYKSNKRNTGEFFKNFWRTLVLFANKHWSGSTLGSIVPLP